VTGLPISTISGTPGVKRSAMPRSIEPMKATLVDDPFSRAGWLFEDKYDGIRAVAFVKNGQLRLVSRNQKELTDKYPELGELPGWIKASEAILDGEIIVLNEQGTASFQDLQARFGVSRESQIASLVRSQKIRYYVFDLIHLDGYDLRGVMLKDRKALLKKVLKEREVLKFAPHVEGEGEELFARAEKMGLEGIVAKNAKSFYEERRSKEWLKIKATRRQEAVIIGYTDPRGSREFFGALQLGLYDHGELVNMGKVGTGFDAKKLKELYDLMRPLRVDKSPLGYEPEKSRRWNPNPTDVHWLKPKLVCEVRYTEITADHNFRHPTFMGLRFDKKPKDCTLEVEKPVARVVTAAEAMTAKKKPAVKKEPAAKKASGKKTTTAKTPAAKRAARGNRK
jgi:bifunctional non-homologous end joining protein LigD